MADERDAPAAATPRSAAAAARRRKRVAPDDAADDAASPQRGGGRLSLLQAAEIVLSRELRPMTAAEVMDVAIAEGMYASKSKKPKNSLATMLSLQRSKVRSGEIPCTFFNSQRGQLEYDPKGRG